MHNNIACHRQLKVLQCKIFCQLKALYQEGNPPGMKRLKQETQGTADVGMLNKTQKDGGAQWVRQYLRKEWPDNVGTSPVWVWVQST